MNHMTLREHALPLVKPSPGTPGEGRVGGFGEFYRTFLKMTTFVCR